MPPRLTDGWDGGDDLTKLELVEDSGLASGVQTDLRKVNEFRNPHVLVSDTDH